MKSIQDVTSARTAQSEAERLVAKVIEVKFVEECSSFCSNSNSYNVTCIIV